jgi:hypothetical protein
MFRDLTPIATVQERGEEGDPEAAIPLEQCAQDIRFVLRLALRKSTSFDIRIHRTCRGSGRKHGLQRRQKHSYGFAEEEWEGQIWKSRLPTIHASVDFHREAERMVDAPIRFVAFYLPQYHPGKRSVLGYGKPLDRTVRGRW